MSDHSGDPRLSGAGSIRAADLADKYDQMLRLADLFDSSGEELRNRARLGNDVLRDEGVAPSAELSPHTFRAAEEEIRRATTGKRGLMTRGIELDADALVVRATVLTYRWIDELQDAAYRTIGSIAGRAIGYLAPEVALGGAIVSAGLIETDALDRDDVASYLGELAENNPELMLHVTSGGGGLIDGLTMRSLLTAGVLAGPDGRAASLGGLRAAGVEPLVPDFGMALRDVAADFVTDEPAATSGGSAVSTGATTSTAPRNLEDLMEILSTSPGNVTVHQIAPHRYIAYLPGPGGRAGRRLRLVGGDHTAYAEEVVGAIEAAVSDDPDARVMLVGSAQGGLTAAEVAISAAPRSFSVDQVVTAGSPSAHVPRIPEPVRVLSLENSADPVALLGSLINAGTANRLTVVFDADDATTGESVYVVGGRAADGADHPDLRAEIRRLREGGFLAG